MSHPVYPEGLKLKALQLLSARDYSRAEMHRKLAQWLIKQHKKENPLFSSEEDGVNIHNPIHTYSQDGVNTIELFSDNMQSIIHQLLDEMQDKGFLSDRRAAHAHVYRRSQRLGSRRIAYELKQKGLDETIIGEAMQELQDTELERAQSVWQRKFGVLPVNPQEYARQVRFMGARGFSMAVIQKIIQKNTVDG